MVTSVGTRTTVDNETAEQVGEVIKLLGLEFRDKVVVVTDEAKKHILATFGVLKFTLVLNFLAVAIYLIGSRLCYNAETNQLDAPSVQTGLYYVTLTMVVVSVIYSFLVMARAALIAWAAVIGERVSLTVLVAMARILSQIIPDFIENFFDKDQDIKVMFQDALSNQAFSKLVQKMLQFIAELFAWMCILDVLVFTVPFLYRNMASILLAFVAASFLIYATWANWTEERVWLKRIREYAFYYAAILFLLVLVIVPGMKYIGLVPDWGQAGNFRILFWAVAILLIGAWIIASYRQLFIESSAIRGLVSLGLAVIVLMVTLMIGGTIVNAMTPKAREWKQGIANGQFRLPSMSSGSSSSAQTAETTGITVRPAPISVEQNYNAGPYYRNPSQQLEVGKAYKFPRDERVYIYNGTKLQPVQDPIAFANYYKCTGGGRPIDCAPVYEMPASIKPGNPILQGGMIK